MSAPFQDAAHRALTEAGRDAALAVARRHGLPTDDPRVLSARGNLVVHLAPAPVVARVATATAWSRADPTAWMAREVAVAAQAVARGAAVLAPWGDPGPHHGDDPAAPAVTLWHHADVVPRRPSPAYAGAALAELHRRLDGAGRGLDLPRLTPVHDQVDDGLAGIAAARLLDDGCVSALRRARDGALVGIDAHEGPEGVLHGDAHAGNLVGVRNPAGPEPDWRWTDLEETCRGPLAWDLAVLAGSAGEHGGPRALASYAAASGTAVPDATALAPFAAARRVEAAVWTVAMAAVAPSRYGRLVDRALAEALAAPGG